MARYIVTTTETIIRNVEYAVEASSREDADNKFEAGNGQVINTYDQDTIECEIDRIEREDGQEDVEPSITHAQLMALPHDPGWDDGREGFEWARFDAMVDGASRLRAELTWGDDSDETDPTRASDLNYHDPELQLEVYGEHQLKEGCLEGAPAATTHIALTQEEAATIVSQPPILLLARYANEWEEIIKCST